MPVLTINGRTRLAQAFAVNRYLARLYNFAGRSIYESAVIDQTADLYADFVAATSKFTALYRDISPETGDKVCLFVRLEGEIKSFLNCRLKPVRMCSIRPWRDSFLF